MEEETREKRPDRVVAEPSRQKAEDVASGCPGVPWWIGRIQWFRGKSRCTGKTGNFPTEGLRRRWRRFRAGPYLRYIHRCDGASVPGEDRCHGITFAERTDVHVKFHDLRENEEYAQGRETPDKAGLTGSREFCRLYVGNRRGLANVVDCRWTSLSGDKKDFGGQGR